MGNKPVEYPLTGGVCLRISSLIAGKRHLVGLVILAVVGLVAVWVGVRAGLGTHEVKVSAWDREVYLTTKAVTVADVLAALNISPDPGDLVEPSLDTAVEDGMEIRVERARPVFVMFRGRGFPVFTAEDRVSRILSVAGIEPEPDDVVHPGLDETVSPDCVIKVVKVSYGDVTEEREIAYDTQRREDSTLEAGLTRVLKHGAPGLIQVVYQVTYEDGVEVSREEKARSVLKEPSPLVLLVGSLQQVSRGGQDIRFERALEVTATAYCPCAKCCGPSNVGKTATGIPAAKGVIAADPRVIPLGTRVYVDGYGEAIAADVGSAIKGNRIDVCFDTHEEAWSWGVKQTKVYILSQ
jgi:3D (Asp-Asp-Asp) domain-containing protein